MLVASHIQDHDIAPTASARRRHGRIVWQERYNGIACVAYLNGQAIAGISGPWSDRYALIWWVTQFASPPFELFETLEAAKLAVAQATQPKRRDGLHRMFDYLRRGSLPSRRPSWMAQLSDVLRRRQPASESLPRLPDQSRQCYPYGDTDLSGMHFSACQ